MKNKGFVALVFLIFGVFDLVDAYTASVAQWNPLWDDTLSNSENTAQNVIAYESLIEEAATAGSQIVVFPEASSGFLIPISALDALDWATARDGDLLKTCFINANLQSWQQWERQYQKFLMVHHSLTHVPMLPLNQDS